MYIFLWKDEWAESRMGQWKYEQCATERMKFKSGCLKHGWRCPLATTYQFQISYRIYSNKRRGVYWILCAAAAAFIAKFIPIELARLLKNFLDANADNKLFAKVTGKRKGEVGPVVPTKFSAFTTELRILYLVS